MEEIFMKQNMTALISAFARAYHTKNASPKIYEDIFAFEIIKDEYCLISANMANGISFFNPNYQGDNPLEWIVNNNLAPSILARSLITETLLKKEMNNGLKQYLILASGYDTSAFKVNDKVKVYELDKQELIDDKLKRVSSLNTKNISYIKVDFNKDWINPLLKSSFSINEKTICSLLGISYYLEKEIFKKLIKSLSDIIPKDSLIIFDYPNTRKTKIEEINEQLAKGANEEMKSLFTLEEFDLLANESSLSILEDITYDIVNDKYFFKYNKENTNNMILAPKGVSYLVFIKK